MSKTVKEIHREASCMKTTIISLQIAFTEQMLSFLNPDKSHLNAIQSLSPCCDKESHSECIFVSWQQGRNHDSGPGHKKFVPHPCFNALDGETEIGRMSRQTAREVL